MSSFGGRQSSQNSNVGSSGSTAQRTFDDRKQIVNGSQSIVVWNAHANHHCPDKQSGEEERRHYLVHLTARVAEVSDFKW